jgi:hypothetical protein
MNVIRFYCGVLLSLVSANAAAAESHRIQHDIEFFFSGAGMVVLKTRLLHAFASYHAALAIA